MYPGGLEQAYPHMGIGGWLKKVLKFEKSHFKNLWRGIKKDPKRLILGVDPISTKAWNKILGRDDRALVNQLGGATSYDYQTALDEGIDIGPGKQMHDVAGMVAGIVGGGAAASGLGAAAGSVSGSAIAPATQTAITGATRVGTAAVAGLDEPGLTGIAAGGFDSGPGEQLGAAQSLLRRFTALDDPYSYGLKGMEHMFLKAEGGRVPSKSPAQAKLMRAVAHGWKKPGGGPSRGVAREFVAADKKAKGYQYGGSARPGGRAARYGGEEDYTLPQYGGRGRTAHMQARSEDDGRGFIGMAERGELGPGTHETRVIAPPTPEDLERQKAAWLQIYEQYGHMGGKDAGFFGGMFGNLGEQALERLRVLEPVGGLEDATRTGGYAVPQPSTRTGTDFDPGSIAADIYEKYGIIDPTWTEYDRTSKAAMQEDPLAHLAADDPARAEYEGYNRQREQQEGLREMVAYPEMAGKQSPQREQLRQHKARVSDILRGGGGGGGGGNVVAGGTPGFYTEAPELLEEEPVGYQMGGLAAMGMAQPGRGGFRGMAQQQMAQGRGRGRSPQRQRMQQMPQRGGRPGRGRGSRMQAMMRQRMGGQRGMPPRGPMKSLGRPGMGGRVQPGGPGGMPGGRPEMISPDDARMPGGRAMPLRGFQQKQAMQRRGNLGGNRVGSADQQGGLARAMQKQTGRPPISRRMGFPGRAR